MGKILGVFVGLFAASCALDVSAPVVYYVTREYAWGTKAVAASFGFVVAGVLALVVWRLRRRIRGGVRRVREWDLVRQWEQFLDFCAENGCIPVYVTSCDNYRSGAAAWIEPIDVDGTRLNDVWFDGLSVEPKRWYAVRASISRKPGYRSPVFLWVNAAPGGATRDAHRAWLRRGAHADFAERPIANDALGVVTSAQ